MHGGHHLRLIRPCAMRDFSSDRIRIKIPGYRRSEIDANSVVDLLSRIPPEQTFTRTATTPGSRALRSSLTKERVRIMLDNCLELVLAYDEGDSLVGLASAVGDGELTATISLLAVHPSWSNQGIETRLISAICRLLSSRGIFDLGALVSVSLEPSFAQCSFGDDPLGSTLMAHRGYATGETAFRTNAKLMALLRVAKPR